MYRIIFCLLFSMLNNISWYFALNRALHDCSCINQVLHCSRVMCNFEMIHYYCWQYCLRGKSLLLRILEDQFTTPCHCLWTSSPCPWTTKSSKIFVDSTFCKQSVMYDHIKSINSVTIIVHKVTVKNGLLLTYWYHIFDNSIAILHCNPVLLFSRKVLED